MEIDQSHVLLETQYLPGIEYFSLLSQVKQLTINLQENYQKQSYRNRCYILGPNKVQMLTVPVGREAKRNNIKDVLIDYTQNWVMEHIRTLQTAYGKSPFFEYYFDYFERVLLGKPKYLLDLNLQMLTLCLDLVKIDIKISDSKNSLLNLSKLNKRFYEQLNRKTSFLERGIYCETKYQQLFGSNFVPNLSIIDLLFSEGPNSDTIISQSTIIRI